MMPARAKKTSLENKHRPNCDYFRLSHLVRILYCKYIGKAVGYKWIGVRVVKLNTEN